jgi:hypothetical protein
MTWKKGQSGNPGGRVGVPAEVRELARKHTPEAIERLVHWMRSSDARASVSAANAILDRAFGKPVQATAELTSNNEFSHLSDEEFNEQFKELAAELGFCIVSTDKPINGRNRPSSQAAVRRPS